MAADVTTDIIHEKQQVHELIDRLAPNQVTAVRGLLEAMLDPVAHANATALIDDEPVTDEDRQRIREGHAWLKDHAGKGIPMDEVLAEFGLRPEDLTPRS